MKIFRALFCLCLLGCNCEFGPADSVEACAAACRGQGTRMAHFSTSADRRLTECACERGEGGL